MQKIPTEDHSVCQNFVKGYPDPPKIILKWFYRLKLVGLKKKSKKKDPFGGNLCEKVSSCIDNVYVLHITPPGVPPSTAVDNGGDRSCQFLGLRPYIQILWSDETGEMNDDKESVDRKMVIGWHFTDSDENYISMSLDEVMMWNEAFDSEEINYLYNSYLNWQYCKCRMTGKHLVGQRYCPNVKAFCPVRS